MEIVLQKFIINFKQLLFTIVLIFSIDNVQSISCINLVHSGTYHLTNGEIVIIHAEINNNPGDNITIVDYFNGSYLKYNSQSHYIDNCTTTKNGRSFLYFVIRQLQPKDITNLGIITS